MKNKTLAKQIHQYKNNINKIVKEIKKIFRLPFQKF